MAEVKTEDVRQATAAMGESIGVFASVNPLFERISSDAARAADQGEEVAALIFKILDLKSSAPNLEPVRREAEPIRMNDISGTKERAFDLAKLGLIIPLLLNNEARGYLASFIQGLIGAETFDKITTALKTIGAVLVGVFAVKLFKQISDTITTFVRLSQVVGVLFGLTQESNELEVEDARKKERESWEKRKEKFEKNKSEHRNKRLKRLENARKLKTVLKTIGKLGKFTGIGFIVGAAAEAIVTSTFDYVTGSDETDPSFPEKEDEEVVKLEEPEDKSTSIGATILKNFISNLTFGLVSAETVDKWLSRAISFFGGGKKEENKQATPVSSGSSSSAPPPPTAEASPVPAAGASPVPAAGASLAPATVESKPKAVESAAPGASSGPSPSSAPPSTGAVATPPSAAPVPAAPSTSGTALATTSENVIGAKKDLAKGSTIVNNVDNSTVIVNNDTMPRDYGSTNYSATVGA